MVEQRDEVTTEVTTANSDRRTALVAARAAKFASVFEGKRFEIVKEVNLPEGQVFQTPFGNKGRNGYVLVEVGNESNRITVGATAVKKAADLYGSVTPPVKEKKRRGRPAAE